MSDNRVEELRVYMLGVFNATGRNDPPSNPYSSESAFRKEAMEQTYTAIGRIAASMGLFASSGLTYSRQALEQLANAAAFLLAATMEGEIESIATPRHSDHGFERFMQKTLGAKSRKPKQRRAQ